MPLFALWYSGHDNGKMISEFSDFLEELLGALGIKAEAPQVPSEIDKVREGGSSDLMKTLIVYKWHELLGPFTADPADIIVKG